MGLEPPLIQWEENLDPSWSLGIRDKDRHGCWWLSFWNYPRIRFRCFLSFREVAKTMKKDDMINIPQLMLIRQELSWIKLTGLMVSQGYHCSFWTCFMKPPSQKRHLHTSTLKTTLFYHTWLWFFQNPTPTHGKWGSLFFFVSGADVIPSKSFQEVTWHWKLAQGNILQEDCVLVVFIKGSRMYSGM